MKSVNGYCNMKVAGVLGASGPSGTIANMPTQLMLMPGKTYYVVMYDDVLNYETQPKAFSIP
jgi:hypothetical protein